MERFVKGDIVVVRFPFSDLSSSKKRPALVIADLSGDDYILAQITTSREDEYSIEIKELSKPSVVRVNKLFTADRSLIFYKLSSLRKNMMDAVKEEVIKMFI